MAHHVREVGCGRGPPAIVVTIITTIIMITILPLLALLLLLITICYHYYYRPRRWLWSLASGDFVPEALFLRPLLRIDLSKRGGGYC